MPWKNTKITTKSQFEFEQLTFNCFAERYMEVTKS